jgi:hypothetical protein
MKTRSADDQKIGPRTRISEPGPHEDECLAVGREAGRGSVVGDAGNRVAPGEEADGDDALLRADAREDRAVAIADGDVAESGRRPDAGEPGVLAHARAAGRLGRPGQPGCDERGERETETRAHAVVTTPAER